MSLGPLRDAVWVPAGSSLSSLERHRLGGGRRGPGVGLAQGLVAFIHPTIEELSVM